MHTPNPSSTTHIAVRDDASTCIYLADDPGIVLVAHNTPMERLGDNSARTHTTLVICYSTRPHTTAQRASPLVDLVFAGVARGARPAGEPREARFAYTVARIAAGGGALRVVCARRAFASPFRRKRVGSALGAGRYGGRRIRKHVPPRAARLTLCRPNDLAVVPMRTGVALVAGQCRVGVIVGERAQRVPSVAQTVPPRHGVGALQGVGL